MAAREVGDISKGEKPNVVYASQHIIPKKDENRKFMAKTSPRNFTISTLPRGVINGGKSSREPKIATI